MTHDPDGPSTQDDREWVRRAALQRAGVLLFDADFLDEHADAHAVSLRLGDREIYQRLRAIAADLRQLARGQESEVLAIIREELRGGE